MMTSHDNRKLFTCGGSRLLFQRPANNQKKISNADELKMRGPEC